MVTFSRFDVRKFTAWTVILIWTKAQEQLSAAKVLIIPLPCVNYVTSTLTTLTLKSQVRSLQVYYLQKSETPLRTKNEHVISLMHKTHVPCHSVTDEVLAHLTTQKRPVCCLTRTKTRYIIDQVTVMTQYSQKNQHVISVLSTTNGNTGSDGPMILILKKCHRDT